MKTSMKRIIYGVSLGLFIGTCLAYGSSNTKEQTSSVNASASATQRGYMGFFNAKSLIGTEIMNDQKQELGDLKDVVFNPLKGETFAAIGLAHDRCALVPWQALKINKNASGKEEITLNTTKQALDSGPAVKSNDWQELNQRSFAQSIYEHYNLQAPAPVDGVSHGALGSHSSTSGKTNNSKS